MKFNSVATKLKLKLNKLIDVTLIWYFLSTIIFTFTSQGTYYAHFQVYILFWVGIILVFVTDLFV